MYSSLITYQCCVSKRYHIKEVSPWQNVIYAARALISVITSAILIEDPTESGTPTFRK